MNTQVRLEEAFWRAQKEQFENQYRKYVEDVFNERAQFRVENARLRAWLEYIAVDDPRAAEALRGDPVPSRK